MMKRSGPGGMHSLTARRARMGYVFVLPFAIGLLAIFLPAVIYSLIYSLCDVQIEFDSVLTSFIGWRNYVDTFTVDISYRQILLAAVKGMLLDTLIILLFSFFAATLLDQKFIGRSAARMIFFLPVILSAGIVTQTETGNMASSLYQSTTDAAAGVAGAFGSGGIGTFFDLEAVFTSSGLDPSLTGAIVYAVDNTYKIVNSSGVQILIFLSALRSIDPAMFEAAKVEGATKWESFWKITFPLLTPMILVNTVYTVVASFTDPNYRVLDYIQTQAFSNNRLGYASALSWVYFVIVLVILGIVWRLISRRIHYLA